MPSILKRLCWNAYLAYNMSGQGAYAFKSPAEIRRDQSRNVKSIVRYAYRFVPYYTDTLRRLGLGPDDFSRFEDLEKLPLLTRRMIQDDPEYFVSTEYDPGSYLIHVSTGTTFNPVRIYNDARSLFRIGAHTMRARSVINRHMHTAFGHTSTSIMPPGCSAQEVWSFWNKNAWFPEMLKVRQQTLCLFDPPEVNIPLMNEHRPDILYTFGSYLGMLFTYIEKTGISFHMPSVIIYTSDSLPQSIRNLIINKYRIPVFSWYMAIEAFRIGFECEKHTGLHLNIDHYPVRIVDADGRNLPEGETGEVIISNLVNRGTVLLNYHLGDMAALLPGSCTCGRSLPLMAFPPGRTDDVLTLPSGRCLHPIAIRFILDLEKEVLQYQVVQHEPAKLTVSIVPAPGADRVRLEKRVLEKFKKTLEEAVSVKVAYVDTVKPAPGGKYRIVVSELT